MNLSRNSTLVNTTSDDQESVAIALSSNVTYVVVGVVSIVVLLLALIPLTVDRKFMKKTILSQGKSHMLIFSF
ncbi:unnamed protein product [Soboliphyme baturini]|uniref:Col_cuticle_N domain-containing protein n=1 Tax=Soboliphyme baturini TaxID=241478 RepID=A0A183J1C7_9BILA|nr:unnamed protein product [Soboliphyme baturini]